MNEKRNNIPQELIESYTRKILKALEKAGAKCLDKKELEAKCKINKGNPAAYNTALKELIRIGDVCLRKKGLALSRIFGYYPAEVVRLSGTFGFVRPEIDDSDDVFIPGKFLLGAMPGDRVLYREIPSRSGKPEGEVIDIIEEADSHITGKIVCEDGILCLLPDTMSRTPIRINRRQSVDYNEGDKVLAEICIRGKRHSEHMAKVVFSFGSAEAAHACAKAMIALHGVTEEFSFEALTEAQNVPHEILVTEKELSRRIDLRSMPIFTIDSAYSKDLDDAVSIEKTEKGYRLGVHIADVSHYVRPKSPLDMDAISRGTSVYYADKVIPMLPSELSNGICSLNPQEDRFAFSALMELDEFGELVSYDFRKTIIRSRVKGVYKEVNKILSGEADEFLNLKYAEVSHMIPIMNELCDVRIREREKRGAPEIETTESELVLNEQGICVDVKPRSRGKSECIIEEMMLLANEASAKFAADKGLPFVYRVHEKPSMEKIENLEQVLVRLGINVPDFSNVKPVHLAQILKNAKDTPAYPIINVMVLRSMAKAQYDTEPIGHFGLALKDYAHFTSPIRRYPDLAIHRIMSYWCECKNAEKVCKRYKSFVTEAAKSSSDAEVRAIMLERDCEDCYKAEYMQQHLGEDFEGIISGISDFGFYVQLPNSIEGMVHVRTLPEDGEWYNDDNISFKEVLGDREFRLGSTVKVRCVKTDVNSGNIDFELGE
jgi:ribonuclease R